MKNMQVFLAQYFQLFYQYKSFQSKKLFKKKQVWEVGGETLTECINISLREQE